MKFKSSTSFIKHLSSEEIKRVNGGNAFCQTKTLAIIEPSQEEFSRPTFRRPPRLFPKPRN
jgi:hypothetical protein